MSGLNELALGLDGFPGASGLRLAVQIAVLVLSGIAAYTDTRWGIIPNRATLGAVSLAPLLHGVLAGFGALVASLFGLLVCALVPLLLRSRGGMAGGDVKAFAAFGAIGGVGLGLEVQFLTFIVASIYALGQLAWTGALLNGLRSSVMVAVGPLLPRRHRRPVPPALMTEIRLGAAMLVAALVAVAGRHPDWLS